MRHDVFISHASEDKDDFVRPLAAELKRLGLVVWYDESSMQLGDSLRQKIDEGLSSSDYGVVVLSKNFVVKHWARAELDGLFAREMNGRKVILPVWHKMTKEEVQEYSPLLGGKLAALSADGVTVVAARILAVIRPKVDSPVSGFTSSSTGPTEQDSPSAQFTELLRSLYEVGPLLAKLGETTEKKDALRMLSAMQRFFYGTNLLTEALDKDLRFATDNLLRVLSVDQSDLHYRYGKLEVARMRFEKYRAKLIIGWEIPPVDGGADIRFAFRGLHAGLLNIVEQGKVVPQLDLLLIRLGVTLAQYGESIDRRKPFPDLGTSVHHSLRELLACLIRGGLNGAFPDPLDRISIADMKTYCSPFWESYEE